MDSAELVKTDDSSIDHPLIPAKRVNGADVFNQAHEKIGKIEDIAMFPVSTNGTDLMLCFKECFGLIAVTKERR